MTLDEFFDQYPPKTLALVLPCKEGTIRMWKTRKVIPRRFWPDIMRGFPELGIRDLLETEAST